MVMTDFKQAPECQFKIKINKKLKKDKSQIRMNSIWWKIIYFTQSTFKLYFI